MQTRSQSRKNEKQIESVIFSDITKDSISRISTRSQTARVTFDFDESSRAWLENKIVLGNGTYKYRII
jgi:hypothetical protein